MLDLLLEIAVKTALHGAAGAVLGFLARHPRLLWLVISIVPAGLTLAAIRLTTGA